MGCMTNAPFILNVPHRLIREAQSTSKSLPETTSNPITTKFPKDILNQIQIQFILQCKTKESGLGSGEFDAEGETGSKLQSLAAKALIASSSEHHKNVKPDLKAFFENMPLFTPIYSYMADHLRTIVEEEKLARQNFEKLQVMKGQNDFDDDETEQIKGHLRFIIEDQLWEDIIDNYKLKLQSAYSQLTTSITLKFIINIVVSLNAQIIILIALIIVVVVYVYIHAQVEKASTRFLTELIRHNYTTSTSYLELLNFYDQILKQMDEVIAIRQQKLISQKDTIAIIPEPTVQQKEFEGKEEVVCGEKAIVTQQANEDEALAEDAQNNLNKVIPKYNTAIQAVQSLDKN
ncbi:MAG: hypothetical protein EZS28_024712 [Streblomastix strix]|uniref:Dynein heavy chain AAA module D4 domain-containing protein n=1 Tax=Streblomastix strix TaxID=222440 RepID=A0A5J4VBH3_9EUKA|nr:MAG: hypothetical protein EZS28_024712 [Streblomastix strix]